MNLGVLHGLFHSQYSSLTAVTLQGILKRRDYVLLVVISSSKPSSTCVWLKSFCYVTPTWPSCNLAFPGTSLPSSLFAFIKIEIATHCTRDSSVSADQVSLGHKWHAVTSSEWL